MRCYININNEFDYKNYIIFLKDAFETSFEIIGRHGNFIHLESKKYKSYLLIRGENYDVFNLLKVLPIYEKNLILITCTVPFILNKVIPYNCGLTKNKNVYYPLDFNINKLVPTYDGNEFGLNFNPCKSEYLLARYSGKSNIYERLDKFFYCKKIKNIKRRITDD